MPDTEPSEADFRELADSLPQLAWMADGQGDIFWYNRRWYEYTGKAPRDMLGWGWKSVHHPDHVNGVVERVRRAFATGAPWQDTFPLRGADGGYRWFLSRMEPRRDADGRVVRWFGTNTDITEFRARDAALSRSERRYQSLVNATAAIVWTVPPSGEFGGYQPGWNAFTGQSAEQAQGWGWLDAVHPEDRARSGEAWSAAVDTLGAFECEYRLCRHDGVWRWMSVRAAPVLGSSGELLEWVGIHTDIQRQKEAEHALAEARDAAEDANQAKSQFIANMSHELRTPLSAVIGYTEMLEEEIAEMNEPQLLEDLKKINSNARHLLGLISDVLDISKIEANRMTVYAENADVAALVSGVASTVDSLIRKQDNTIKVEIAGDLGGMYQDQVKLRQCLFNLLGNAAKFTRHGVITLSAERLARPEPHDERDWLRLEVRDSGIGMTEEQLGRLFQRFSQADASTTRRFGGTGLGLAITKSFVELLGGRVSVASTPGEGSTFTILLPANYVEPGAEAEPGDDTPHAEGVVLVVDDDPASRDLVSRFLHREGFQVRVAADGRAGLALARSLRPRAILLDVMMPQMDGWTVLGAIKSDPDLADTPVIMISFVNEPNLAAALGASDYLNKPVEWDHLKRVMERIRPDGAEGAPGAPSGVLVIDDDQQARERMQAMLARRDVTVALAENGARGLEAVRAAIPSLILLDLSMPEMDGFDFLEALRAKPEWRDIPVIVMTARSIGRAERMRLDGKIDRLITKGSVNLNDLANQLRDFVQSGAEEGTGA